MDYSASIHDADNPVGASPWGTSPVPSPQHPRISSYPPAGEGPSSPTRYSTQSSSAGYGTDDTLGGGSYSRPDSSAGADSIEESDGRPDTAESVPSQPDHQQTYTGQQEVPAPQQRHEPQRYHKGARPAQAAPAQQYKLQAKITGLERSGRKDPIMRFDVHVRELYCVFG
jgi:hypothetical protein